MDVVVGTVESGYSYAAAHESVRYIVWAVVGAQCHGQIRLLLLLHVVLMRLLLHVAAAAAAGR